MKDFEFYTIIRLSKSKKIKQVFPKLRNVYQAIPATVGCLDNIGKKGGCASWCCKIQTPQLLYSEFLFIWDHISKKWDDDDICSLFERCMRNVINPTPSKQCVFFNDKTNLCGIHTVRPYNCRVYGITPEKEFSPRYEKLQEEYKSIVGAVIRPQCNLISIKGRSALTIFETNRWWEELNNIEEFIGIPKKMITDKMGGSYRTPHDHILLYNMPENVLNALAAIRLYSREEDKLITIRQLVQIIRNEFKRPNKK